MLFHVFPPLTRTGESRFFFNDGDERAKKAHRSGLEFRENLRSKHQEVAC